MSYRSHSGCTGKVRYESKESAKRVLDELRQKPAHDPRCRAYKCRHCGKWHLGRARIGKRGKR